MRFKQCSVNRLGLFRWIALRSLFTTFAFYLSRRTSRSSFTLRVLPLSFSEIQRENRGAREEDPCAEFVQLPRLFGPELLKSRSGAGRRRCTEGERNESRFSRSCKTRPAQNHDPAKRYHRLPRHLVCIQINGFEFLARFEDMVT